MNKKYLFLDDIRHPYDAFGYSNESIFLLKKWVVVKNYNQFVKWINKNGLPDFISFDHDLADSHYTPSDLWTDYEKSKEWQDKQVHSEKTGYECALWLVDYCLENDLPCPHFFCHSVNPVGKDKINRLLETFCSGQ